MLNARISNVNDILPITGLIYVTSPPSPGSFGGDAAASLSLKISQRRYQSRRSTGAPEPVVRGRETRTVTIMGRGQNPTSDRVLFGSHKAPVMLHCSGIVATVALAVREAPTVGS